MQKPHQWFLGSSTVLPSAWSALLILLPIQMERFSKQKPGTAKACVTSPPATSGHRYLSHFLLTANLSLKGIIRGLLKHKRTSLPMLSLCPSCRESYQQTLANTWLQVITRNKKYLVSLNASCLSPYPGCHFHLEMFFTAVIWSQQIITKRADYVKTKWHWAVKAKYPHHKSQPGPCARSWIAEQQECLCGAAACCQVSHPALCSALGGGSRSAPPHHTAITPVHPSLLVRKGRGRWIRSASRICVALM